MNRAWGVEWFGMTCCCFHNWRGTAHGPRAALCLPPCPPHPHPLYLLRLAAIIAAMPSSLSSSLPSSSR